MILVQSIEELQKELSKRGPCTRVFVPTMGNLHQGHLSLIRLARQHGDFLIVSIFVNRLQFEPHGDFDKYPRTLRDDVEKLERENVDLLFAPDENELYSEEQEFKIKPPPELSQILEGETRPNFFQGICTVVMKLFWLIQPQAAVFGKKDYQQLLIIKRMRAQFNVPVKIIEGENKRDEKGLALSSRNNFLDEEEREEAAYLYQALRSIKDQLIKSRRKIDYESLEQKAMGSLSKRGWKPYYVSIRERKRLSKPTSDKDELVVLAAAQLGSVRLIDNLEI